MFCGNPQQVADQMEEWFTAPACDGFVLPRARACDRDGRASELPGKCGRSKAHRFPRLPARHPPLLVEP
jgi:hypothetical protein